MNVKPILIKKKSFPTKKPHEINQVFVKKKKIHISYDSACMWNLKDDTNELSKI